MDQAAQLLAFQAQTSNVRALRSAMKQVHRCANEALRSNNSGSTDAFTKMYAVLFCAWAEANFSKIIHTPYGFSIDEIQQIKKEKDENGISPAWKKAVQLGLRHLDAKRGSFKPNAQRKLEVAIDAHVFDPSVLRNKLAHGQWVVALNRNNDAANGELTKELAQLDVIKIMGWVETHSLLAALIESLIESPKKMFVADWFGEVGKLEASAITAKNRTLTEHVSRLKDKDARTGAKVKRGHHD